METTPFELSIPDSEIEDLRARLRTARLPEPLPGDDWDLGVPVSTLRDLVTSWEREFDWRAVEAKLNAFPQFLASIDGTQVHFLHVRSPHDDATPLLLTHGWPGSILEFLDIIDPLTNPPEASNAFHLVIPSLPGFGFSGPISDAWDTNRTARAWVQLMEGLGYARFGVQGGDIGAAVSPAVARVAPQRVIGVHINGGNVFVPPDQVDEETKNSLTPLERERLDEVGKFMQNEYGYIAIQATRPQTLAYGLTDSPAGQLAWMLDKYQAWTWPESKPVQEILGTDRLLAQVSLYWFTRTAGTSAYVGYASPDWSESKEPSGVPTAFIEFAQDVGIRRFLEQEHTIARWSDIDHGGHFAAMEAPDELVADVRAFFGDLR